MPDIPFSERITCSIPDASQASGLGRSKLYEAIADGSLETVTIGSRRLIVIRSLKEFLDPHERLLKNLK